LVRRVIDEVFSRPWFTIDSVDCASSFGISPEICGRILTELERGGVVRQTRAGTWIRSASF
jgi:hypothetical protein